MIKSVTRIILSCILLWFVYQETGWATTLALFLIMIAMEAQTIINMYQANHNDTSIILDRILRGSSK